MKKKILLADDDLTIKQTVKLALLGENYEIIDTETLTDTRSKILNESPDLVFLDMHFKGEGNCLDLLRFLAKEGISIPIIILSGAASAKESAEAIKLGATDYLEKPITGERLLTSIEHTLEYARLKRMVDRFSRENDHGFIDFIGNSIAINKVKQQIQQYASKDIKVLITAETGAGKELVAQAIWKQSNRNSKPYIIVNAAAIPDTLVESELFGHKKGSFTGAVSDQIGKIEMATGGTLFLDEIGDLSASAQTKLLRFLETGEIQVVGSQRTKTVDVRLIAATSRNLEEEIQKGRFRNDLFYRLNVARIVIPPLRERGEDISLLFTHFIRMFERRFGEEPREIDHDVFSALSTYSWPGNVRELKNIAERVVLITTKRILKEHVRDLIPISETDLQNSSSISVESFIKILEKVDDLISLKEFKHLVEKAYINRAIRITDGSVTKAAKMLEIDRSYLHQKISSLGETKPV